MFKSFLIVSLCFVVVSCVDQKLALNSEPIDFSTPLDTYNKSKTPSQHEGIVINGNVKVLKYTEDKERKLVFLVSGENASRLSGENVYRKYQFQYGLTQVEADLPESINGQVAYLGDNLILFDAKNQQYYSFAVEGYENRMPQLTPKLGIGLISVIFDNGKTLLQSGGSCSCSCTQCLNCDFNCGTASASCNCAGNSQSATCRQCYNASCTQCNEQ